jgi:hypothetical protein
MTSAMLLPLLLAVQAAPAAQPLRVDIWPRNFVRYGELVDVAVTPERDGFLVVLRVDTYGRTQVLFPVDPTDDAFVRGGERVRLYSRAAQRGTFAAFERDGSGTVFAALSDEPYDFRDFMAGGYWATSLLGLRYAGGDEVASLLQIVTTMAGSDRFDYTVARYWVSTWMGRHAWRGLYSNACLGLYARGAFSWYGHRGAFYHYDPLLYDPYFDPFLHDPFFYDPFFSAGFGCYRGAYAYWAPGRIIPGPDRSGILVDRGLRRKKGEVVKPLEPRRRDPGTVADRGVRSNPEPRRRDPPARQPAERRRPERQTRP